MAYVYNKKPRRKKGYVYTTKNMPRKLRRGDHVAAILEVGELVVPKRHTRTVTRFLKSRNIRLPGMR
jgi:hypothetical protein